MTVRDYFRLFVDLFFNNVFRVSDLVWHKLDVLQKLATVLNFKV